MQTVTLKLIRVKAEQAFDPSTRAGYHASLPEAHILFLKVSFVRMSSLRSVFPAITEPFADSEKRMNVPAARLISEVSGFSVIHKRFNIGLEPDDRPGPTVGMKIIPPAYTERHSHNIHCVEHRTRRQASLVIYLQYRAPARDFSLNVQLRCMGLISFT